MPSTHTSLHYHVVFSAKKREALSGPDIRDDLHAYLGGIVRGMGGVAYAVGGTGDHGHVFMGLKAAHCLADMMRGLNAGSSKWYFTPSSKPGLGYEYDEKFVVSRKHLA